MSARLAVCLLLVFAFGRAVTALDDQEANSQSTRTSISHYNINYLPRQITPSTSSAIWTPSPPLDPTIASPVAPSSADSVVGIANTDTDSTFPPTLPAVIYITALPPSTSAPPSVPEKYRKDNKPQIHLPAILFSPYVVAPISAFLGLIQGILFSWCCIARGKSSRTRKDGRARSLSLEPGPPYVSIPAEDKDLFRHNSMTVTGDSPSKYSVHGSRYTSSQGSLWLQRAVSTHSEEPGSGSGSLEKAFLWPADHNPKVEEDDPFLVPPSRATTTRTATTDISFRSAEENAVPYSSLRHKSIRQGILERLKFGTFKRHQQPFALPLAHEQYKDIKSDKGLSIHTPSRVSSITRTGTRSTQYSRRRNGHGRSDSDVRVDEVKRPERTYSPASSPRKEKSLVRGVGDETEWIAGSGFRLVQEDPGRCSTPSKKSMHSRGHGRVEAKAEGAMVNLPGRDTVFTSLRDPGRSPSVIRESVSGWLVSMHSSNSQPVEIDKYTILPVRKTPTKRMDGPRTPRRRSSNSRSRQNSRPSTPKVLSRVDSSILPCSPPQIMSPPLESQLLFCSPFIPPSVSMPLVPHKGERQTLGPMPAAETQISDKTMNKVHSPTPLPLAFASSPETSPYRNLLGKGPPAYNDVSATSFRQADSLKHTGSRAEVNMKPSPPENVIPNRVRGTPAARHSARQGALTKVDQIMLKGWSERGTGGTASLTMFGAVVAGEEHKVFRGDVQ